MREWPGGCTTEKSDHRHRPLLRACREWGRCRDAAYGEELAPFPLMEKHPIPPRSNGPITDITLRRFDQKVPERFAT
jgi:hypothetical protein